jgi:MoaA/NifB/PqqE/SkfB family radical SAM enzyme/polysaccharide pyruvyl transferase WcaK-like protein
MLYYIKQPIKKVITPFRPLLGLIKLGYVDLKRAWWHQYFPIKPIVINLNATDICNSGCIMCNIWKREKEFEFSAVELTKILSDPLFSKVKHVGITGGEPSLRDDLPQLFETVIKTLPSIVGVSMITNGIEADHIYNQIIQINKICLANKTGFSVMVSLDGVGVTHDLVRGNEGNFESSVRLIKKIKAETNIPLSTGCTITKTNIWKVDKLLDYLKENNIYGRFRIAEYIKRLYNDPNKTAIRNFNEDEAYHLQLFFHKLKHSFESNGNVQRTYQSIIEMLGGKSRKIGCPYHTDGIVLNARGEIAYCAPKSRIIGNTLDTSGLKLWNNNLGERRRIIKEDCNQCIHDYHAPLTYKEAKEDLATAYSKALTRKHYNKLIRLKKLTSLLTNKTNKTYTIFIIGWYGTETVGDKAILGGIINYYKEKYNNNCQFVIGSLFPFITERTILEMGLEAKIVDSTKLDLLKYSRLANETVMGGGPLMDLDVLYVPYIAFYTAQKFNKTTTIFGCGLGPLKAKTQMVQAILKLSTNIKVRDSKSKALAQEWTRREDIEMYGDPAKKYITQIAQQIEARPKNELACFLREWTHEYAPDLSKKEFENKRVQFEKFIANKIINIITENGIEKVKLYHMHNFHIGNDDRDFSRRFINTYFANDNRVSFDEKLSTIESIITAMKNSKMNLCMRFHSVLFAHSLNTNFKAIDYTLGGKIHKFLADNNSLSSIIKLDDVLNEDTTYQHIR